MGFRFGPALAFWTAKALKRRYFSERAGTRRVERQVEATGVGENRSKLRVIKSFFALCHMNQCISA
jgi:hypothetical protein